MHTFLWSAKTVSSIWACLLTRTSLENVILHRKSMSNAITSSLRQFVLLHTLLHTSIDHLSKPIYCREQPRGAVLGKYSVKTDLLTPTETGSPPRVIFMTIN